MKLRLFLSFLAFPYALAAQETAEPRHGISLSLSPDVSIWPAYDFGIGGYDAVIKPGFRIAASYHYRLTHHWWLRAGLGFARLQTEIKNETYSFHARLKQNMLSVPLALRYRFNDRWYAEFEASANFLLNGGITRNEFRPGAGLGFGYQHPVGRNASYFVQPSVRMLNENKPVVLFGKPDKYSLGIDLGFRKEF